MKRVTPSLVLFFLAVSVYGQSPVIEHESLAPNAQESSEVVSAARAIAALSRLDNHVLVHRSQRDFEESGKLARVTLEVFSSDLQAVTAEVELILLRLPQGKLKSEISNALYSYRDGEFWWRQMQQPRVVNVSALSFTDQSQSPSQTFYTSSIPYTVAIHWRQANRYLKRAAGLLEKRN